MVEGFGHGMVFSNKKQILDFSYKKIKIMIHDQIKLKQLMEYRMEKKLNKQIKTKTFKRNQTSIAYEIL